MTKSFLIGIVLGILFVFFVHTIPPQPARQIIALFLAFTACVYAGAVLAQKLPNNYVFLELAVAIMVFSLSVVGLRASTTSLAVGYIIQLAGWFPPLCAAFDFVVAIALLIGPWRPMA
jgi:hypothetical protein